MVVGEAGPKQWHKRGGFTSTTVEIEGKQRKRLPTTHLPHPPLPLKSHHHAPHRGHAVLQKRRRRKNKPCGRKLRLLGLVAVTVVPQPPSTPTPHHAPRPLLCAPHRHPRPQKHCASTYTRYLLRRRALSLSAITARGGPPHGPRRENRSCWKLTEILAGRDPVPHFVNTRASKWTAKQSITKAGCLNSKGKKQGAGTQRAGKEE